MNAEKFKQDFIRLMNQEVAGEDREKDIHGLLNLGYEFYISEPKDYAEEIRKGVYVEDWQKWYATGRRVLTNYRKSAEKLLKQTADIEYLKKYLVAFSIDNGSEDYRDDAYYTLPKIYDLSVKKGLDPRPVFASVAAVSDSRPARGGFGDVQRWLSQYSEGELDRDKGSGKRSISMKNVFYLILIVLLVVLAYYVLYKM